MKALLAFALVELLLLPSVEGWGHPFRLAYNSPRKAMSPRIARAATRRPAQQSNNNATFSFATGLESGHSLPRLFVRQLECDPGSRKSGMS